MSNMPAGIHHITAISSSAQKTYHFYSEILQLRLVKQTVNFDSPDTYHLYFGDEVGTPGTLLTFFPFERAGTGMRGTGQPTKVQFLIPKGSLGHWLARLQQFGVRHQGIEKQFGNSVLRFFDDDGLQLELVMEANGPDSEETAIKSFFGIELSVRDKRPTIELLEAVFGYRVDREEDNHTRLIASEATHAKYIDIFHMPGWPEGITSAGTVHHVALRTADQESQAALRKKVVARGLEPTESIDRNYFYSVYFREPGGILLEIATDLPGFTVDESVAELGTSLKLPAGYESMRERILKLLPTLSLRDEKERSELPFVYKYVPVEGTKKTLVLLHGTGGDEQNMLGLADLIAPEYGILALRGNAQQQGLNRFFLRDPEGINYPSLQAETKKLAEFMTAIQKNHGLSSDDVIFVGYSNGANILQNLIVEYPELIKAAVLMHPELLEAQKAKPNSLKAQVLITSGKYDQYLADLSNIDELTERFRAQGAEVQIFIQEGDHQISDAEIAAVTKFVQNLH
jgi:predicted esterase/catechol-2,3-dioxygenase